MDKEQIIEWLRDNLSLDSHMIYDSYGKPTGAYISIEIFHNKEKFTLGHTEIYFE